MSGGDDKLLYSKALGTESGGEISCTVDETNRIRAMLGLRPLDVGKPDKEKQAVENFRAQKEAEDKAKEARAIAERLEKAKEKRLLHAKVQGTGLGDASNEDAAEFASAADWVKRSRKMEISNKEQEHQRLAKRLQEEEEEALAAGSYQSSDLKGLSVMHGADEFSMGQEVILTLADSSVLETDKRGRAKAINEGDDVLENVNLADLGRKAERDKAQKKAKQNYTGYDDAEFEEGADPRAKPSILPQYDKEAAVGPKLVLGQDGRIAAPASSSTHQNLDDADGAAGEMGQAPLPQSLRVDVKESEDYYSRAEYSSTFKPKGDKDKKKKKKKLRQKEQGDEMDLDGGSASSSSSSSNSSSTSSSSSSAPTVKGNGVAKEKEDEEEVDDDAEIALSLARARRLALKRQREQEAGPAQQGDAGARWCQQRVGEQQACSTANESKGELEEWNSVTVDGRKADGTFVFSETTEFSTRLQAQLNESARSRAEAAVKADERKQQQSEAKRRALAEAHAEPEAGGGSMDVDDGMDEDDEEEEQGDRGDDGAVGRQPLAATSMAATLALLKGTGELGAGEKLVGRARDTRAQDPSARDFDVKLEYRDETGRKLTQKEAFRQLNYQFHGIAPGKKKQEKRLKQLQLEDRAGSSRVVSGEGGTMRSLVRAQEATGSAFITVTGSSAATQSGAPTVTPAELAAKIQAKQEKKDKAPPPPKK